MGRALVALTLLAAAVLAAGCGGSGGSGGGSPTTTAAPTASGAGTPASGTAVTIDNFAFSPASLNVNVGQQVTWTNKQQGVTHTVTADGGRVRPSDAVRSDVLVRLHRAVGWPRWPR
jgi:plastocyanin